MRPGVVELEAQALRYVLIQGEQQAVVIRGALVGEVGVGAKLRRYTYVGGEETIIAVKI